MGLGLLTSCGADGLAVGDVEASEVATPPEGVKTVSVTVPTGTLDVSVAVPAQEVGDLQAPDGGSLLWISTDFQDMAVRRDVWSFAAREGAAMPIGLRVSVEGTTYPVGVVRRGAAGTDGGEPVPRDLVVALGERLVTQDDVSVEVTYDGLAQTVHLGDGSRDPGPADALYADAPRPGDLPTVPCANGPVRHGDLTAPMTCRVGPAFTVPYLPALGWAEEGRAWTVVGLGVDLPRVELAAPGVAAGSYAVTGVESSPALSGQQPVEMLDETIDAQGARYAAQLVFASTPEVGGLLRIDLDYTLRLADSRGPGKNPPATTTLRRVTTVDLSSLGEP
ncbi:hypothetical protein [Nocardioides ferulae]|uniref:hypothetical protein n=1 Tax=Nocardioides ferulae TaxID=2340821 RepID=UPI000EB4FD53|nr:hypothetical protein [Nocardioides ferulae]